MDDDAGDRKLVRRLLGTAFPGANVREARNEAEAFSGDTKEPDAALIDYRLPGSNGFELLSELKQRWPGTSCIILSGSGDEEIAKEAIRHGASDYIPKRLLNEAALKRMINHALQLARMKEKLDERRRELEVFADVLVHDLKAPIRAVSFLTEELEDGLRDGQRDDAPETLALLKRSADQMRALVDSLACHVRADRDIEFERASLRDILDTALWALNRPVTEAGACIEADVQDCTLLVCKPQLAQLFQNVIGNAIKYAGPRRPVIGISTRRGSKGELQIEISDNGVGIAEGYVERVFETFTRAPSDGSVKGSGLGLATCRKIAMRHGGQIWCKSEVGAGTTVILELPEATVVTPPPVQDAVDAPPGRLEPSRQGAIT
ncbi:sensor histidine kinase [Salipiger mucosus]|uniref:sensor histidine kinase n=1 Tax=Salipiger mucosus TaxID=263378 RepID=UPI00037C8C14|nr:hybrid sensor histidine kinase/response regulator [Salipiger mucosus]